MLSVKQRIMFNVHLLIFKLKQNLLPDYICNKWKLFTDLNNYNTRNCTDFIIPDKCNTTQMLNFVLYFIRGNN